MWITWRQQNTKSIKLNFILFLSKTTSPRYDWHVQSYTYLMYTSGWVWGWVSPRSHHHHKGHKHASLSSISCHHLYYFLEVCDKNTWYNVCPLKGFIPSNVGRYKHYPVWSVSRTHLQNWNPGPFDQHRLFPYPCSPWRPLSSSLRLSLNNLGSTYNRIIE